MKLPLSAFLLACFLSFTTAKGACLTDLDGVEAPIDVPSLFSALPEKKISSRYKDTQCLEFHIAKRKDPVGFLCSSNSSDFLADSGISSRPDNAPYQAIPDEERKFTVGTPMAEYDMSPTAIGSYILYVADADCDEADGPVYRATSTCHIAMMPLSNGRFLYSNFVLENHTNSSRGVDREDVMALWTGLKVTSNEL